MSTVYRQIDAWAHQLTITPPPMTTSTKCTHSSPPESSRPILIMSIHGWAPHRHTHGLVSFLKFYFWIRHEFPPNARFSRFPRSQTHEVLHLEYQNTLSACFVAAEINFQHWNISNVWFWLTYSRRRSPRLTHWQPSKQDHYRTYCI